MISLVLWSCPTSCIRTSLQYVLGLYNAVYGTHLHRQLQDLPVPVKGVSVRAQGLRPRRAPTFLAISARRMLPSVSATTSAPWSGVSRLNTRPIRTSVNASPQPLRTATHDSRPARGANSSQYDSFNHYTLPVLTGAPLITSSEPVNYFV